MTDNRVLRYFNYTCVYCGGPADQVDHFVPISYRKDNSKTNLLAACWMCNLIAGNKVFDTFDEKRFFILAQYEKPKWKKKLIEIENSILNKIGNKSTRNIENFKKIVPRMETGPKKDGKSFKDITVLRSYLLQKHEDIHSWRLLQSAEFPGAKPGTLSRIANDPTYEPKHQNIRDILRLAPSCPVCGSSIHKHPRKARTPIKKTYYEKWWDRLKPKERKKLKRLLHKNATH